MEGDHLYGLPLEQFVPERTALAKSLRADGRREEAAEVAKLRKPSVAAWAVNQLVRTQTQAVAELFAAGDALAEAHTAVVSGTGDGPSLREAVAQERSAVDTLLGAARGLLSTDGHDLSPAIIDRVADTFHAAALDEDAREQVRDGRLERELRHVGMGAASFAGAVPAAPGPRPAPARAKPEPRATPAPPEPKPDLAEQRREARAAEADARRRAERAERSLRRAVETRDRAAQQLAEADEALADAEAEAREAAEAHRQAAEQLKRLPR